MKRQHLIVMGSILLALILVATPIAAYFLFGKASETAVSEGDEVAEVLAHYGDDAAVLLPVGADDDLIDGIRGALPSGTKIVADPDGWAPNGIDGGTIPADIVLPGGETAHYVVLMARDNQNDGQWVVLTTYETEAAKE